MGVLLIVLGLITLAMTWWELQRDETDTLWILGGWLDFDVTRAAMPVVYWSIIAAQGVCGVASIVQGIQKL